MSELFFFVSGFAALSRGRGADTFLFGEFVCGKKKSVDPSHDRP